MVVSAHSRARAGRVFRAVAAIAAAALITATLVAVGASSASAVTQGPGTRIYTHQLFYSYVGDGESLDIEFAQTSSSSQPVGITVQDPTGAVVVDCTVPGGTSNGVTCAAADLTSTTAGVWKIVFEPTDESSRYLFDIVVNDADSAEIPGRTWTDVFTQYQSNAQTQDYWLATREGYVYGVELINMHGQGSAFRANGFGLVDAGTCTPIYKSVDGTSIGANGVFLDPAYEYSDACGDPFWVFFEQPDDALPASSPSPDGTLWVRPAVTPASATNLQFTADGPLTRSGQITFDLVGVNGGYMIQIDTNADGDYTDPTDRIIPWGSPPGTVTVPFDGLDGLGDPIGVCQPMNARVVVERAGEIHFVLEDVEQLGDLAQVAGGIRLTGETPGVVAPNPLLYWDDTELVPNSANEPLPYADGTAGVDTSTIEAGNGAHGWRHNWGDRRSIENWSYYQANAGDEVAVQPPCAPGMTIDKRADLDDTNSNGLADVGEQIVYSFLVSNTGNTDLFDVAIDDPQVTSITPTSSDIAVGMAQLFTAAPYTVTQADVDGGGVSNSATAVGEDPTGGEVETPPDGTFVPGPDRDPRLTIEKSAEITADTGAVGIADLGDEITYTFEVTNTGNTILTDVSVVDPRISGTTPASATLEPGDSQIFVGDPYTVTQDDLNTGAVDNTATAVGTSPIGDVESPPDSTTVPTPVPDPLLELVKTAELTGDANSNGLADVGDTITYTFLVTNTGNVDLENVVVIDPKVGATTPTSADIGANSNAGFTATYVVQQGDIDHGSVDNVATAQGVYPVIDGDPVTVTSSPDDATVPTPERQPGLKIEKSGVLDDVNDNGFADVGETIDYEFIVTNIGNTTLAGVEVLDARLTGLTPATATLGPTEVAIFSADPYTVTQADVDAGVVHNSATSRGHIPGGPEITSPPDELDIPGPPPAPAIQFVKTGTLDDLDGDGRADAGEQILYEFVVTNVGNVTLFDVTVVDDMLAGLLPVALDLLAPGQEATVLAAPYTVTAADERAGEIVNVAHALGTLLDGDTVIQSDEDDVVIPAGAVPVMASTGATISEGVLALALLAILAGLALVGARRIRIRRG